MLKCHRCTVALKSSVIEDNSSSLEELYHTEQYWKKHPNRQDGGVDYDANHPKIRLLRENLIQLESKVPDKGRLLDVGCANGVFLDVARKHGWNPSGVDIAPMATEYARSRFGLDVFTGDLSDAPWPEKTFDAITSFDVIEHVTRPLDLTRAAFRLLKPGGVFLMGTPNAGSLLHFLAETLYRYTARRLSWPLDQIYGLGEVGHIFFFNRRSMDTLLRVSGFSVEARRSERIDQGLWRKLSTPERLAGAFDRVFGSAVDAQYRLLFFARRNILVP